MRIRSTESGLVYLPAKALGRAQRAPVLVGESAAIRRLGRQLELYAPRDGSVLFDGETGSGKEVAAEVLHAASPRAREPFLAFNGAALPETLAESELFGHEKGAFTGADARRPGLLEQAGSGTVLIDEIGSMSPALQAKLLRVMDQREYLPLGASKPSQALQLRARICAASCELRDALEGGRFRADLLYRFALHIHVPSLAERREDIRALVVSICRERGWPCDFSEAAYEVLERRAWPGNVRSLRRAIEVAIIHAEGEQVGGKLLEQLAVEEAAFYPPSARVAAEPWQEGALRSPVRLKDRKWQAALRELAKYVREKEGSDSAAAKELGTTRNTIARWLKK